MAAIVWQDVVDVAAEFCSISLTAQFLILDDANAAFAPDLFGGEESPRLKLLRAYAAAHFASPMLVGASYSGPISSERVDEVGRSYSKAQDSFGGRWAGSSYGQIVAMLIRQSAAGLPRSY